MLKFEYVPLQEDIQRVSLRAVQDCTWLIYPTERSSREARQLWQQEWAPLKLDFITMEELKARLVYSDKIRLADEKRLVCLYQAMTPEDRAYFHIQQYPDLIDWGNHMLNFLLELADECVEPTEIKERMEALDFDYQDWQYGVYTRMLAIRQQYKDYIKARGYTDAVFDLAEEHIHLPADITRFVFVNQYYYTMLEQRIIHRLSESGMHVTVYYQGNEEWFDPHSFTAKELTLAQAFPQEQLPFDLEIVESVSAWQMGLNFLNSRQAEKAALPGRHLIIDAQFHQQPYRRAYHPEQFSYAAPAFVYQTDLGRWFQILAAGLDSLVYEDSYCFVKLDWLLQAIGISAFMDYFCDSWDAVVRDVLIAEICGLADQDILYIDMQLNILETAGVPKLSSDTCSFLHEVTDWLQRWAGVQSVHDFIALVDSEDGVIIDRLLSEEEKSGGLKRSFYEALAGFAALDELKLVEDWQCLYPSASLAAGICSLFNQYLKPRRWKKPRPAAAKGAPEITSLLDTRNLHAHRLTFMNLVEGELPSSRGAVWLFNEAQRKKIGLKTWEDIRRWERYYFFRLIASARKVDIYTISNQEQNIESSSFASELFLFAISKDGVDVKWEQRSIPANTLLTSWLQSPSDKLLCHKAELLPQDRQAFFRLPYAVEEDFGAEKRLNLSWTACEHLLKQPFVYYMKDVAGLRERIVRIDETLSRKMFGNLVHRYMMMICQRLAEQHEGILSMQWEWINSAFLEANLKAALTTPVLSFQLPRNYNKEYLVEVLSPFMVDTAGWFFHTGLAKDSNLEDRHIRVIPESDRMSGMERTYKQLLSSDSNAEGISVGIRGKADLRLETNDKRYIIDFKTGNADKLQLLFYMWFYYLIDNPELEPSVQASFYKMMDKQIDALDTESRRKPLNLQEEVLTSLQKLISEGYTPATDSTYKKYYADITRVDLLPNLPDEDEEEA